MPEQTYNLLGTDKAHSGMTRGLVTLHTFQTRAQRSGAGGPDTQAAYATHESGKADGRGVDGLKLHEGYLPVGTGSGARIIRAGLKVQEHARLF